MKLKTSQILLLSAAFLIIFSSCNKETDEDILVSKTWTFNKLETNTTDSLLILMVDFVEALMTGATFSFNEDGKFTQTVLNESETGTWSLSDDEKKITMADDSTSTVYDVINITESEFSYYETDTENCVSYKLEYYWK